MSVVALCGTLVAGELLVVACELLVDIYLPGPRHCRPEENKLGITRGSSLVHSVSSLLVSDEATENAAKTEVNRDHDKSCNNFRADEVGD